MIRITFPWATKLLKGGLLLVALSTSIQAENTCDKAPRPCLDQPREGDTQVTGKTTVDASNNPPAGAVIMIKVNDAAAQQAQVKPDGTFILTGLPALNRFNTVQADQTLPTPVPPATTPTTGAVRVLPPNASGDSNDVPTRFTLGLFGINAAGSSSSGPSQQYFAEINLLAPLRWLGRACSKNDDDDSLSQRCWIWINPRIASVPSASSTAINSLSATSLTTSFGSQTLGQITQSFEFQAGGEYYVIKPADTHFWGMGQGWAKSSVSVIVGGGALTPFNSIMTAPEFGLSSNLAQQFNQNASLPALYPQLASALCNYGFMGGSNCPSPLPATKPTTVAFVFPNRSRFYRGVYGGLRFRFFYFTGNCYGKSPSAACKAMNTYPGTFDLRFGEDESVTGGHLVPLVVTLTGSFPIPGTKGAVRLFGSSYIRAYRNQNTLALVLVPSPSFTSLDNPAVVVQPIPRSDQDYFRLGLGIDLFALLGKLKPQ